MLRMPFLKMSKAQKLLQKHPQTKNKKSHVRRPQIKKVQKRNYSWNWKILRITFLKILRTQNITPKTLNKLNLKKSKSHVRSLQMKNSEKSYS